MGSSTTNSAFGPSINPWTPQGSAPFVCGGSSGGAAASVSAGIVDGKGLCYFQILCYYVEFIVLVAIGSDTGGSVRHPASFCGVVGFKPSYGLIPRYGLLSYASSMDTVGIISSSVLDVAATLDELAGSDDRDPTALVDIPSAKRESHSTGPQMVRLGPVTSHLLHASSLDDTCISYNQFQELNEKYRSAPSNLKGVNVGIPIEFSLNEMNADVKEAINILVELGANVKYISLPSIKQSLPCYYVLACAEAASNLSKYDGIRYGYRHKASVASGDISNNAPQKYSQSEQTSQYFLKELCMTRGEGFGGEVIKRILTGNFVLSQNSYAEYYEFAAAVRLLIRDEIIKCLSGNDPDSIDVLIGPTTPILPWSLTNVPDQVEMLMNDLYTVQANLAGVPAISVPVSTGKVMDPKSGNQVDMPIGIQLMGRFLGEKDLLRVSGALESVVGFTNLATLSNRSKIS